MLLKIFNMTYLFTLPSSYTVRYTRNWNERWLVYKLLVLPQGRETPNYDRRRTEPYLLFLLWLFLFIISLPLFTFLSKLIFYIVLIGLSVPFLFFSIIYLSFLIQLLFNHERRLAIALHQGKVIGCAIVTFRENYSVLLGI